MEQRTFLIDFKVNPEIFITSQNTDGLRMKSDLSLRADIMFLFLNDERKTSNYYNYKYSDSMK